MDPLQIAGTPYQWVKGDSHSISHVKRIAGGEFGEVHEVDPTNTGRLLFKLDEK